MKELHRFVPDTNFLKIILKDFFLIFGNTENKSTIEALGYFEVVVWHFLIPVKDSYKELKTVTESLLYLFSSLQFWEMLLLCFFFLLLFFFNCLKFIGNELQQARNITYHQLKSTGGCVSEAAW